MNKQKVIGLTLRVVMVLMVIVLMYGCTFSNHLTGTSTAVGKSGPLPEQTENSSSAGYTNTGKGNLITPYTYRPNK